MCHLFLGFQKANQLKPYPPGVYILVDKNITYAVLRSCLAPLGAQKIDMDIKWRLQKAPGGGLCPPSSDDIAVMTHGSRPLPHPKDDSAHN